LSSGDETAGARAITNAVIEMVNSITIPTAITVIVTNSTIFNGK